MAKRLSAVGFHCHVQHGGISSGDGHAVVLLGFLEHPQQLIGYDPIEHGNGNHRQHKGQECIYLFRKGQHVKDWLS